MNKEVRASLFPISAVITFRMLHSALFLQPFARFILSQFLQSLPFATQPERQSSAEEEERKISRWGSQRRTHEGPSKSLSLKNVAQWKGRRSSSCREEGEVCKECVSECQNHIILGSRTDMKLKMKMEVMLRSVLIRMQNWVKKLNGFSCSPYSRGINSIKSRRCIFPLLIGKPYNSIVQCWEF